MKKCFMLLAAVLLTMSMSAKDLTGIKFYVNPGHGSFGPNDRPMATIPYPNLSHGMPDTCGFYESNTNLQKAWYLGQKLQTAGAEVMYSHTECGPWPYEKDDKGNYPGYTWAAYQALPDYRKYNRVLSEMCAEVDANDIDYFISIHSNAVDPDGTTTNYLLYLYNGNDASDPSHAMSLASWPHRNEILTSGIDVASHYTQKGSTNLRDGESYSALKHGTPGFLVEGYFHTYQPARHRALNYDYCHMEGLAYYRGIVDYYGADKEEVGYIIGTVKDSVFKMDHPLFTYVSNTNDQWVPCNGAEVILKKGGVEVDRYTVDNNYNGLFIFEGLEPGDDYSLEASCDGYYPMHKVHKAPFSVKANATTYKFLHLKDTAYIPPKIIYYNYPNPEQPVYLGVPNTFEMQQSFVGKHMDQLLANQTIRRTLYRNGKMYILAIDEAKEPTLAIADENGIIEQQLPTDFCAVNGTDGLKLSDIAFTAEGVLVGCSMEAVSFTPSNKWNLYKWQNTEQGWIGELWQTHANNETAGNFNNSYVGQTIAYSGTIEEGTLVSTAITTGSNKKIRFVIFTINNDKIATAKRNQDDNVTEIKYGANAKLTVSPRDNMSFIYSSSILPAFEWKIATNTADKPIIIGTMPFKTHTPNYFQYASKSLMIAPAEDTEGKNIGVALYDITKGVDKPQLIKTTNTTLEASNADYTTAFAQVNGADLTLYLVKDTTISKFTTIDVQQPVVAAIGAYELRLAEEGDNYVFSFVATTDAKSANLVFYNKGGYISGKVALTNIVKGANTATVAKADLPGKSGQTLTWAVELEGETIANWGRIHHTPLANLKADASTAMVRPFISINNNPESDYFQYLYVMDRQGSGNAKSGLHAFTPDYKQINTAPLKGGRDMYGSPYRSFVDDQGYIWISDGRDATSGIIVADPANLEGTYEEFFVFDNRLTTTDYAGLLTNNGVDVGSSSVGLSVYGTGKDAKLLTINEDAGTWLKHMSLVIYNIGTEEGTYQHSWDSLPSAQIELKGMVAIDGYPLGCSHGVWIATNRSSGQNNSSATALQFYDWEGTRQLSSAEAPYKDLIDGCAGGACALNEDESVLYMIDGSQNLLVWDIVWEGNKPVMTLRYSYKCGMSSIREMHLDYAGNLVCSGDKGTGIVVFTVPSEENVTLVPAKKALTVTCPGTAVPVTGVALDTAAVELIVEDTHTLTAIITPEDATDNYVKWTTSDAKIATVNEGVVTAVAVGTATITVTTVDGGYTATCQVTVKPRPVTGVTLDKAEATIEVKETITLLATVAPANATNKDVTWTSDNAAVATVVDGVVTAVAEGSANITVTTVDGAFTATCKVTVNPISVKGVALSQTEANLKVEETVALQAIFTPADAANQNVAWTTSDAAVATVENGVVTAVALGTATITVTTEDGGFTATCMITVVPTPVTGVTLDFTELALEVPATATLTAIVAPEDATDKSLTWASDNEDVAIVADGVVTAIDAGTANITVTTVDGNFTATCVVTVSVASGVLNIHALDVNAPMYDVLGRQVDKTYRGIVIQNGQAFLLR